MLEQLDLLIQNTTVLNARLEAVSNQSIGIKDGKIVSVGETQPGMSAATVLDGRGKLFMPGLVDAHTHTCQQLLRGRILDELPMIWTRIMLPFESGLTEDVVEAEADLACLEMIKSGTTAFADAGGLHMHKVAGAAVKAGLRAALTCSTIDSGNAPATMKSTTDEALDRNTSFFEEFHGAGEGRISVFFSIRSMLSCSEALMRRVTEAAAKLGTGLHAHMNEYPNEVNACLENHRMRPMEYLNTLGVLGPNFLAAHGILFSDREIALAREHGVKVVHCPFSNSGKGIPPTPQLLSQGVSVGLGTDGSAHGGLSLWNEMKIFRCVMNAHIGVPMANPVIMPAETLLTMATRGGAAAIGCEDTLGVLEPGRRADMISINLDQPHILPTSNLAHTLVESVNAGDVSDMIVNGKLLMQNREVLTMDEARVLARAKEVHEKVFSLECVH